MLGNTCSQGDVGLLRTYHLHQVALEQHIHRAACQGGHVVGQVLQREPGHYSEPAEWGGGYHVTLI